MQQKQLNIDKTAILIVIAAILMNFILSILNNHILSMSRKSVEIVQLLLTACIPIIFLQRRPKVNEKYYLICAVLFVFYIIAMVYKEQVSIHFLYKLFIIQLFLLLGASVKKIDIRYLKWLLYFIFIVALIEAIFPSLYSRLVNPFSYYVSTRDWVNRFAVNNNMKLHDFGLYVGANRSTGSIFNLAGHRVGSIFLEPLSLGYFCVIYSIIMCNIYWGRVKNLLLPLGICFILVLLSDTRSALFMFILLIPAMYFVRLLPKQIFYLMPILFLIFVLMIIEYSFLDQWYEYKFRLSITTNAIINASFTDILFGKAFTIYTGDSGIIELINGAGLIGAFLFYITASGLVSGKFLNSPIIFSSMLFLLVASIFGGAFFSIKTASLLGFSIGAFGAGAQIIGTGNSSDQ